MNVVKIGENYFQRDIDSGFYPIFSYELNRRVKNKQACVVIVVGEAGESKSYTAIQLARNVDKRFGIDQIVFTYSEYCKELGPEDTWKRKMGKPIVFDEPSYAMGKREWYKQINMALTKTIESQRFLVRPLFIPVINANLLDKTIRDYLIIFRVKMIFKGRAIVHRLQASQDEDKVYRHFFCTLDYPILDFEKCQIDSCLDCEKLKDCMLLRAQYERKKRAIQSMRYEQDEEQAKTRETKEFTLDQLCSMIEPYKDIYLVDDKIDARKLRYAFHEKLAIKIGHNKSYEVKTMLEMKLKNNTETPQT